MPQTLERSSLRNLSVLNTNPEIRALPSLPTEKHDSLRRRMTLDFCKWDPQVGDVSVLAPFPLAMSPSEWERLSELAEKLTEETLAAEQKILHRPDLMDELAVPPVIIKALEQARENHLDIPTVRVMRFDFHPTLEGWRISEVNSDVPGGFTESSSFTQLMASQYPGMRAAGNPVERWVESLIGLVSGQGTVCTLSAPGFMEDHQVLMYLARKLGEFGCRTFLATPGQLRWRDGTASLETDYYQGPVAAIVRFYQGEWLASLPKESGWHNLFAGCATPIINPGSAILTESKRFPLIWDRLQTPLPTWKMLLPETREIEDAPWQSDDSWIVKSAYSNTGDDVGIREFLDNGSWLALNREVKKTPHRWLVQRRFEALPIFTPLGPLFPCVGIYTINGRSAGAYVRMSRKPLIDYSAMDGVLVIGDKDE